MFTTRPHERYDLYSTPMTSSRLDSPCQHRWPNLSAVILLFLVLAFSSVTVSATPIQSQEHGLFGKRDTSPTQTMSPKIYIPIVVGIVVVFCIMVMTWTKTSWRKTLHLFSLSGAATAGAPLGGSTNATRELTAEQLAGTINARNQTGNAAPTTRRTRRPRRTPSQMSVTSLPPYNKEPGEEELVIFRGRDMEDATMPAAVAMTSLDEERDGSVTSHDNSQASRYSPMPTSPHNTPLLRDDDAYGDLSLQSLPPPGDNMTRYNFDNSSHETSSLMRVESNLPETTPDPRGEAPAYFEVVDLGELQNNRANSEISHAPTSASPANSPEPRPHRQSGFRSLLNRMSMVGHQQHNRNDSANSTFSSNISHGPESTTRSSTSRASNHRTTPSGSGSLLTTSMFRTISRQRSTHTLNSNRLNSPSLISLNSISSPLTHTVMRTEFTYPKTGPTAEQLKVISSRESFARFGVPYGADAIAFAASSSRQDLLPPPPDFEAAGSEASPRPATPGPSRLRSSSNVAQMREESPAGGNGESSSTSSPSNAGHQQSSSVSLPSAATPPKVDEPTLSATETTTAIAQTHTSSSISKSLNSMSLSGPASIVPEPETTETSSTSARSPSISPTPKQTISEFGKLSASPPSSYHDHTASSSRSESRASVFSYQSYATAAESITASTAPRSATDGVFSDVHDSENASEPSTPRLGGQHMLEPTDVTVVPDKRTTILASARGTSTSAGQ